MVVFLVHIPQNSSKIPAKLKRSSAGSSLRPAILNLAEKFESAGGWGSERIFSKWVSKQPWRQCLPPIFQFEVERETCLTIHIFLKFQERTLSKQTTHFLYLSQRIKVGFSDTIGFEQKRSSCIPWEGPFLSGVHEANAFEHSELDRIRLGMFPHEVVSAFYHFRSGDLFFGILTGTPKAT